MSVLKDRCKIFLSKVWDSARHLTQLAQAGYNSSVTNFSGKIKNLKTGRGFTLIELFIVIAAIIILAVFLIPYLASGPAKSRDAQRKADLHDIRTALEAYRVDKDVFPTPATWTTDLTGGALPYFKGNLPTDPKTHQNYNYLSAVPYNAYSLSATLENKKDKDATGGIYTLSSQ